jgi:hypothetical protein
MGKQKGAAKSSSDSLTEVLKTVREFIKSLWATIEEFTGRTNPAIFFSIADEGTLFLDKEEAQQYRKCLRSLISAVASDQISTKAIEHLYQKAILVSLDIAEHRADQSFEARLDQAIQDLRAALRIKPCHFQVYYPVDGLTSDGLPFSFGNVNFCIFSTEEIMALIQNSDRQQVKNRKQNDSYGAISEMIQGGISGKPVGVTTVMATEHEAAKALAFKELRLTLDVMNFFSDLIPYSNGYFFLPGDRSRAVVTTLATSNDVQQSYSIGRQVIGPLALLSAKWLSNIDQTSQVGLTAASSLLVERKGKLQERLLSAIQWAGRATVDSRKEEAFLLYAIALESLILAENEKDELVYRLRTRVAHLIGEGVQSRRQLSKQVKDLYDVRSQIVHSGRYQVTDADFGRMRLMTKSCIIRVLADEIFIKMRGMQDFIDWFDEQILK